MTCPVATVTANSQASSNIPQSAFCLLAEDSGGCYYKMHFHTNELKLAHMCGGNEETKLCAKVKRKDCMHILCV